MDLDDKVVDIEISKMILTFTSKLQSHNIKAILRRNDVSHLCTYSVAAKNDVSDEIYRKKIFTWYGDKGLASRITDYENQAIYAWAHGKLLARCYFIDPVA